MDQYKRCWSLWNQRDTTARASIGKPRPIRESSLRCLLGVVLHMKSCILLARTDIRKITFLTCGFSSIKIYYSVRKHLVEWCNVSFRCSRTCYCICMVSETLSPLYQSRPSTYIRGLILKIPWNSDCSGVSAQMHSRTRAFAARILCDKVWLLDKNSGEQEKESIIRVRVG